MVDQRLGMAWVPLQGALKARMVEVGQGLVDLGTHISEGGHQLGAHVFQMGQRVAVDVIEQAHLHGLAVDLQWQ
ncbi:hypothetical protein D9M73_215790 [compost metagenome]